MGGGLGSIEEEMTTHFIWTFGDALSAALLLVVGPVFLGVWIVEKWRKKDEKTFKQRIFTREDSHR